MTTTSHGLATQTAVRLAARAWRDVLNQHHALVSQRLEQFRGREIDTAGDGFLAAFDGPARAVRAACAIVGALRDCGRVGQMNWSAAHCTVRHGVVSRAVPADDGVCHPGHLGGESGKWRAWRESNPRPSD